MDPSLPRVLVRSDSQGTSLGEGTVDPHDRRLWPALLSTLLDGQGHRVAVRNASSAGLTIAQALDGFRSDPLVRGPMVAADVVVLGLGINDWWPLARPRWVADRMDRARPLILRRALRRAYRKMRPRLLVWTRGGFRPTPPGQAREHLTQLVTELQGAGRGVLLVTPFPVRSPKNPHLDGNTWEACDTVVAVGEATGAPVVDCRTLFQPIEWETISIDHIHVNEAGQKVIAEAVAEALLLHDLLRPTDRPADGFTAPSETEVMWRSPDPAPAGVTATGAPIDIHEELRQVQHDPLVREAYDAARSVVLGLPDRRLTAWDAERLVELVDVISRRTRLVLMAPGRRRSDVERAVEDVPDQATAIEVFTDPTEALAAARVASSAGRG